MVLIDLIFNYGDDWICNPQVLYPTKVQHIKKGYDPGLLSFADLVNEFVENLVYVGVQQLIIEGPCGTLYEIVGDEDHNVDEVGTNCNLSDIGSDSSTDADGCDTSFDNSTVDYHTIAQYFKRKLQDDPKYKVREMMADLKRIFELNVSHGKCKRAKRMVLETLEGSFTDEYNKLEAYAIALRESNPGSDIVINLSKNTLAEGKRRFLRMYICFQAMKMGFSLGFRPYIGVDVVDKETKATWIWFMELLKNSLNLKDGEGITFMSDMQKGLTEVVRTVLPKAHHRFCVKHIEANWCKSFNIGEHKKPLWWCAWYTYEEEFKDQLKKLGELKKEAVENQSVDNNLTESFNKWILDSRFKPIIKMLEDIRLKVMNMIRVHEDEVKTWAIDFNPKSMQLYNEYIQIGQCCKVNANGDNEYEVS
ncbi:uncharacterized protein [Nicotiana sylvestris]|uniref:uncharacterized protein n=1 Tax=Nicotiana sylvestris TaxID=4096 RepID=UPI00388CE321